MKESTSSCGARYELTVAVQLMAAGWHVFRALSPAGPTDLIIQKNGTLLRLQIKSKLGQWVKFLKSNDVLGVVYPDGRVRFYVRHRNKNNLKLKVCEVLRRKAKEKV